MKDKVDEPGVWSIMRCQEMWKVLEREVGETSRGAFLARATNIPALWWLSTTDMPLPTCHTPILGGESIFFNNIIKVLFIIAILSSFSSQQQSKNKTKANMISGPFSSKNSQKIGPFFLQINKISAAKRDPRNRNLFNLV